MNIVFNFKNQVKFRRDNTIDLKMLKISIKQWNRFYKHGIKNTYIAGSYSEKEIDELINYLTTDFLDKYNIKILNVGSIPKQFNLNKVTRVNYQTIKAFEYIKEPFIMGTNDIFPIKYIDNKYLNKEYSIRHKDYSKLELNKIDWLEEQWIYTIEYFKEKYNFHNKEIYELHNAYVVTKEFIDFYLSNPELLFNSGRDIVLALWLKMNGKEILSEEEFCKPTFYSNKLQINKNDLKKLKMIDVTLPNHQESKKILKRIKKWLMI